jgi:hypothetical protein
VVDKSERSYVFIVSYGRSGSTLLQKVIGSIEGYHVVGENYDTLYSLFLSYESARLAKKRYGKAPLPLDDPWHGASAIDPKSFGKKLARLFVDEILKPPASARVIGFKEVRYFNHTEDFAPFLEFMIKFIHPAKIVFNVRSPYSIARSAWWRDRSFEEVEEIIARYESVVDNFVGSHPEHCIKLSYDAYTRDPEVLQRLFDFLGEKFDRAKVAEIVAVKLTHGRHAKSP